ncbi:MAG: hypothetical protein M3Q70_03175 [bacterium]|nr:hypothetical protein [bacterium]
MTKNLSSIRRLTENEAIFRKHNEKVTTELAEVQLNVAVTSDEEPVDFSKLTLHFFCECADENCRERVILKVGSYNRLHQNRRCFVVKSGHQVKGIEKIIKRYPGYILVEKLIDPPERPKKLHATHVENV